MLNEATTDIVNECNRMLTIADKCLEDIDVYGKAVRLRVCVSELLDKFNSSERYDAQFIDKLKQECIAKALVLEGALARYDDRLCRRHNLRAEISDAYTHAVMGLKSGSRQVRRNMVPCVAYMYYVNEQVSKLCCRITEEQLETVHCCCEKIGVS